MRKIIYSNEKLLNDEGIQFGRGVFETILWKDGPVLFEDHLKRLKEGMAKLKLSPLVEEEKLKEKITTIPMVNRMFKIIVTEKNIIISFKPIPYNNEDYERGFSLKLSEVKRNNTSILPTIKSINYLENRLEREKAIEAGYDEVVFLNLQNNVAETSSSNIFIVNKGVLLTPKVDDGILNGVIRNYIVNNFEVIEKSITYKELLECDEVFLTNSIVGIMKVTKIEDKEFTTHEVTKRIEKLYQEAVFGGKNNDGQGKNN